MSEVEWKRRYYADGTLYYGASWVNGQQHGVQKGYYKDGALWYETPWVRGQQHGVRKVYRRDGTLHSKEYWVNGQLREDLTPLEALVIFGEEL